LLKLIKILSSLSYHFLLRFGVQFNLHIGCNETTWFETRHSIGMHARYEHWNLYEWSSVVTRCLGTLGNDLFINYLLPQNVVYNYDILLITVAMFYIVRNKLHFCILPTLFHDILNLLQNYTFHNHLIPTHSTKAYRGVEVLLHSLLS